MATTDVIRVMVAHDHPVTGEMQDTFADEEANEVAGQAADSVDAVKMVWEIRPDVIVTDLSLPNQDGVEPCREIVDLLPEARVLMLTASAEKDDVIRAVSAGATGFVQRFTSSDDLDDAVRRAFRLLGDGGAWN